MQALALCVMAGVDASAGVGHAQGEAPCPVAGFSHSRQPTSAVGRTSHEMTACVVGRNMPRNDGMRRGAEHATSVTMYVEIRTMTI